jgi:phosphatidylinositol glycan class B
MRVSNMWVARRYIADMHRSLILAKSAILDRMFYGKWVFPPLRFLYFNIAQSLAVFYGQNDWHYYLSQGLPLLLTTLLPFGLTDIYRALKTPPSDLKSTIRYQLASLIIFIPLTLSLISHKEVRFIYPLLPPLHILA